MRKMMLVLAVLSLTGCSNGRQPAGQDEAVNQKFVHKYGVALSENDWQERGKDGRIVTTQRNGVVVSKNYVNGVLDGDATYTFPNRDTVAKEETYTKGILVKELLFYPSGAPKQQALFHPAPGKKTVRVWFENGLPQSVEEYQKEILVRGEYYNPSYQVESQVENSNGKRTLRDQYGQLTAVDLIQEGVLAEKTTFFPTGAPKEIIPYVGCVIQGEKLTFLPTGEPSSVENWEQGLQVGVTAVFQNGEKVADVPYVNGQRHGKEQRYRNGSAVVEDIAWVNGKRHGPNTHYLGDAVQTDWYFQDKAVTPAIFHKLENQ